MVKPGGKNSAAGAAAAGGPSSSSRVIVKNVPKHATDVRLRDFFATAGEVTDCKILKTQTGESRQFAFIGFRSNSAAQAAVKQLNRSFFDTSRLSVELALAPGSEGLQRPWSKYSAGSAAHKKRNPEQYKEGGKGQSRGQVDEDNQLDAEDAKQPFAPRAKVVKAEAVTPQKAGMKARRLHVEFGSSDEEDEKDEAKDDNVKSTPAAADFASTSRDKSAFDTELDDLAYLRTKTRAGSIEAAARSDEAATLSEKKSSIQEGSEQAAATSSGKKKLKKKKGKRKAGSKSKDASDEDDDRGPDGRQDLDEDVDKEEDDKDENSRGQEDKVEAEPLLGDDEDLGRDDLDSGRLYVTNIPYGTSEEELRSHFEPLGEITSVHICKDEDTLKSRGFAYVTYVFPECGARAIAELDAQSFQGRLLRITPAKARPQPANVDGDGSGEQSQAKGARTSSFKRKQAEKRKKVDAHLEHTWNLLYVSANAAADVAASQLGVSKAELFGKDAENSAVTAALTETSLIQQTKRWLQREGIRVDAFEQSGTNLINSKAVVNDSSAKRRDDTLIVKHLPAGASNQELHERFRRYGELLRCSLAPSGTVAIVQYTDKSNAQFAFQKLAFSRYRHVPLYLEWAPDDVFLANAKGQTGAENQNTNEDDIADGAEEDDEGSQANLGCLFVKNLSFATTDEGLRAAFKSCKGLRSAVVMRKKAAVTKGGKDKVATENSNNNNLSMGYGFLEFATKEQALDCMKRRQGILVDGHSLQLQVSQRQARGAASSHTTGRSGAVGKDKKKKGPLPSSRLCVRNLAFEATSKELRQLFSAYGSVTALRIPKKADYTGHRGFAFIDFASKAEAAAAFEALQHTHLYGRRLVIEAAEERQGDVATVAEETQKRKVSKALRSEATKRRRTGLLDTSGDGKGFEEMMM